MGAVKSSMLSAAKRIVEHIRRELHEANRPKTWKCRYCGAENSAASDVCEPCLKKEDDLRSAMLAEIQELLPRAYPEGKDYVLYWWTNVDDIGEEWWMFNGKGKYYFMESWDEKPIGRHIDAFMAAGKYTYFMAWEDLSTGQLRRAITFLKLKIAHPKMSQHTLFFKSCEEDDASGGEPMEEE